MTSLVMASRDIVRFARTTELMRIVFEPSRTTSLNLDDLELGDMPGMSARFGGACAEAAATCLEEAQHVSGTPMSVDGECTASLPVRWTAAPDTAQQLRTWGDPQEAAEHGAYGVAALLVTELTDYTVWERARKGKGGFDFWLRRKDDRDGSMLQGAARLEVSGIGAGSSSSISSRVSRKSRQIEPSDSPSSPGVVAVVDFGVPLTRVKCK